MEEVESALDGSGSRRRDRIVYKVVLTGGRFVIFLELRC